MYYDYNLEKAAADPVTLVNNFQMAELSSLLGKVNDVAYRNWCK